MRGKMKLTSCLIAIAVIISLISSANTVKAMELDVTASSSTVTPGETVTITVSPDSEVSGIDLVISYDSSLFTYTGGFTSVSSSSENFSNENGQVSYIESPTTSDETKTVSFTFTASDSVGETGTFEITSTAIVTSNGSMYAGGAEDLGITGTTSIETKSVDVTIVSASSGTGDDSSSSPVITPSSLDMKVGDTETVSADEDVTWSSGDTSVVTVDPETGVVTAVGVGNTTITATDADGNTSSIPVTVTSSDAPVLTPTSATLNVGDTLQIESDKDIVSWTSSNTNVATVDENGLVTAVGVGTATITATDADGNKSTVTITVTSSSSSSASSTSSSSSSLPKTGEINYGTITFITVLVLAIAIVIIRKKFKKVNFKEEKSDDDR